VDRFGKAGGPGFVRVGELGFVKQRALARCQEVQQVDGPEPVEDIVGAEPVSNTDHLAEHPGASRYLLRRPGPKLRRLFDMRQRRIDRNTEDLQQLLILLFDVGCVHRIRNRFRATMHAIMPITPFHFGPGAAIHAAAPRYVSFLAFCAANILMDIEPLYYMLTQQYPLHRFFHTYIGASLVAGATVALFVVGRRIVGNQSWPSTRAVAWGAALGAYSHVLLDSIMHRDIRPLAPFSDANPLLGAISLSALHWTCLESGVIGALTVAWSASRTPSSHPS